MTEKLLAPEKTALVACSQLVEFAGSEIATLEIARALQELGYIVTLAALEVRPPFQAELDDSLIDYVDLSKQKIERKSFDLVWVTHYVVAYYLFAGMEILAKNKVFSSLSFFEPLETPPLPSVRFSTYLVNSHENFLHFINAYPDLKSHVKVFPNTAPTEFVSTFKDVCDAEINSVCIVSNHVPTEVMELTELLRNNGIKVDLIGIKGNKIRVTPELLCKYSFVISIGKTVQYCLVTGIPIFCYDHFGGPGWITLTSIDVAEHHNFSGRCNPVKKNANEIFEDIYAGYSEVLKQRVALSKIARERFNLLSNLSHLLDSLDVVDQSTTLSETERRILVRDTELFLNLRGVIANYQETLKNKEICINEVTERNLEGQAKNLALSQRLSELQAENTTLNENLRGALQLIDNLSQKYESELTILARKFGEERLDFDQIEKRLGNLIEDLYFMRTSTSWKITSPVRRIAEYCHGIRSSIQSRLSWTYFLGMRAGQVIKYQGFRAFLSKSKFYLSALLRRRVAAFKLKRSFSGMQKISVDKSKNEVLVSFVIPIYDRTDELRIAIKSALSQSDQRFEIILVTDGSPMPTLAVVNEFRSEPRVKIFNYPTSSGNAVRGRNKGILESSGKYIAFLDSDDISFPDRIERSLVLLEQHDIDVVYGAWVALLDGTREIPGLVNGQIIYSPDSDLELLKKVCVPCQSTVMVRKELFYRAGFLKPAMKYREDHELWARLAYFGARFKSIQHPLVQLRLHSGNNEINFKSNDTHWETLLSTEYMKTGFVPKKIVFIVAGIGISGGLIVILKHANYLISIGHDVLIVNVGEQGDLSWSGQNAVPVVNISDDRSYLFDKIDLLFATFWMTCEWLDRLPAKRKLYFIQSDERLFYDDDRVKEQVASTYRAPHEFVTIAPWISEMLRRDFSKASAVVPNGIDLGVFSPSIPRTEKSRDRLRILIEGPITIPFKGVADAYAAVEALDCEIWLVSSSGKPDPKWRVDQFFEHVHFSEMSAIYSSCDILLKMSRIESFSYPPLEAMACGCAVVVGKVQGSIEYIVDGVNALIVEQQDIAGARNAVERLMQDPDLRRRLIEEGFRTAKCWSWERSFSAMAGVINISPCEVIVAKGGEIYSVEKI